MSAVFPTPDDINAIRGLILAQIEAFRADDAERAFSFASPMIQQVFGTPAIFLDMVRTHYHVVYRPRQVRFGELRRDGEFHAIQRAEFLDGEGQRRTAQYELNLTPNGWRINGCLLDWPPGASSEPT
jgi:hypothetical protein